MHAAIISTVQHAMEINNQYYCKHTCLETFSSSKNVLKSGGGKEWWPASGEPAQTLQNLSVVMRWRHSDSCHQRWLGGHGIPRLGPEGLPV